MRGTSGMITLMAFGFGLAAGVLLAVAGSGVLEDGAGLIVSLLVVALVVLGGLGAVVVALRRPLWRRIFGHVEVQIEQFARPLSEVAERAIARDPEGATAAARDLVSLALARYSWVATRRWLVASLTALVAATAALAGTALLFKQNRLIAAQTALLVEQNAKLAEQTLLLQTDLQLAEAARNAELSVAITEIAAALGAAAAAADPAPIAAEAMANVLDPLADLDRGLLLRIVSVSRAVQPYRFLDAGPWREDASDGLREAMATRRADLPRTWARMADWFGWQEQDDSPRLIDRPASPERGQLLDVLSAAGLRNLEPLVWAGLDLSFAHLPGRDFALLSVQRGRLSRADLSGGYLTECDFGGAVLDNARFRRARLTRVDFSDPAARLRAPLAPTGLAEPTQMPGADFTGAVIVETDLSGVQAVAARFDGAVLLRSSLAGAELGAATFRGTVLVAVDLAGAGLKGIDLDGAVVFGADWLADTAAIASPGTFEPGRFRLEPLADPFEVRAIQQVFDPGDLARATGGAAAFRVVRVQPFAD